MKTMKLTKILFSVIIAGFLITSCSKDGEDGAIGPQGPQGEQGVAGQDGEDGQDGAQGEQGDTGTPNVIYSEWFASEFGSLPASPESEQLLVSLGLSDYNRDQDLILIYGRHATNAISYDIFQLPFELFSQSEVYRYRLSQGSTFSALYIDNASSDGGNKVFTYFNDYRYIIIPGGVSTSGKSASADYAKMSYAEIMAHFNIPE